MRLKDENGFTLIELIVVVSLIGIMAAIAVPSFFSLLPNMRLKAAARGLYSSMQKAKIEAVKRNTDVVVLLNAVDCTGAPPLPMPSPGGSYSVFVDDGAGVGTAKDGIQNGTELTISSSVTMPKDVALCTVTGPTSKGFTSQGFLTGIAGSVTMSNSRNKSTTITLTMAGGVRIQ